LKREEGEGKLGCSITAVTEYFIFEKKIKKILGEKKGEEKD